MTMFVSDKYDWHCHGLIHICSKQNFTKCNAAIYNYKTVWKIAIESKILEEVSPAPLKRNP